MGSEDCNDGDACTVDTCNGGTCANTAVPDGQPPVDGMDIPTDCIDTICMGGQPTDIADDTENPDTVMDDCVILTCSNSMVVSTNEDPDTPCGMGMNTYCNADGECVGCTLDEHCGMPTECAVPTCDLATEMCMPGYMMGPLGMQTAGDCRTRTCNGMSPTAMDVLNNADPTMDAFECTEDNCQPDFSTAHPNRPAGTDCSQGGGNVCDGGTACVACNVGGDCGGGNQGCVNHVCVQCDADPQCGASMVGRDCLPTNVCGCDDNGDCSMIAGRNRCYLSGGALNNTCQECNVNADCNAMGDGDDCTNGNCGCNNDDDCGTPCRRCDMGTNTCVNRADGAPGSPASPGGFACNGMGAFYADCSVGNQATRCADDTCTTPPSCN